MAVAQQPAGDRDRLADRLPLTEDRLRHPLSEDTMVVHRGEPQVLIGQRLQAARGFFGTEPAGRSEEHTSELQSQSNLVCRLLLEKKKNSTRDTCPCPS